MLSQSLMQRVKFAVTENKDHHHHHHQRFSLHEWIFNKGRK